MSELNIKDFKAKHKPIGISMELRLNGESAYETGKIGGHTPLYTDDQIQDYLNNQPQLTIPKSVAEKIDKFIKVLHFLNEFEAIKFISALDLNGDRTPQWLKDNPMLVFAYLAGKALGVDLVKVGEG